MSIELNSGLKINAPVVLDDRMVMTKEQMLDADDKLKNTIPDGFLVQCKEDGQIYVYHADMKADPKYGKFKPYVNKDLASMAINAMNLKKIEDYLYEVSVADLDYDWADKMFKEGPPVGDSFGACSSMRRGNFHGRNFDWKYDNAVEFVVKTEAVENVRHATIGTASNIRGFNKDFVESREWTVDYKAIPFLIVDGINDAGLCCNINVVPAKPWTTVNKYGSIIECNGLISKTTPTVSKLKSICSVALPRFVLDNFSSARDAANYIKEHVEVFPCEYFKSIEEEIHIMISDKESTFIVEFVEVKENDGLITCESRVMETNRTAAPETDDRLAPVMTNFHVFGIAETIDSEDHAKFAHLWTPYTKDSSHDAVKTNRVEPYGSGLERYNILIDEAADKYTKTTYEDMFASMRKAWYTHTYTEMDYDKVWYSEMVMKNDTYDFRVDTDVMVFEPFMWEYVRPAYEERSRETGKTWQTLHTNVFDMEHNIMYIACQENPNLENSVYRYDVGVSPTEVERLEIEDPGDWHDAYDPSESSFTATFSDNGMVSLNGAFVITDTSWNYSKENPFEYKLVLMTKQLARIGYRIPRNTEVPAYFSIIGDDDAPSMLYPIMCKVFSYAFADDPKDTRFELAVKLPIDGEPTKVKVILSHTIIMVAS